MRKKIAGILAIVLLVSVFQGIYVPTYAAENVWAYKELSKTILYENKSFKLGPDESLRSDEVILEIPMMKEGFFQEGTYTLTYYVVPDGTTPKKVTVEINTDLDTDIQKTKIQVTTTIEGKAPKVETIDRDVLAASDANGKEIALEGVGLIRFYIAEGTFYYSTSGIKMGVLTPFKLEYTGDYGIYTPYVRNVFKGVSNMNVLPTHLLAEEEKKGVNTEYLDDGQMSLPSLKRIPYTTTPGAIQHKAGERPGIVVSFDKPTYIDVTSGDLKVVDNTFSAEILLEENYVQNPEKYRVQFGLVKDAPISTVEGTSFTSGKVIENGTNGKFEIYISQSKEAHGRTEPHIWNKLKDTSLLQASLTLKGAGFADASLAGDVTKEKLTTTALGNTYIRYDVFRTSESNITFEIQPFIIKDKTIKYSIYYNNGKVPIQTNTYKDKEDIIKMVIDKGAQLESYRVGVNIGEGKEYQSQIVDTDLDKEPVPPYAEIIRVEKAYVIPNEADPTIGLPEAVGIDVAWQAPSLQELNQLLEQGPLFYELFINPDTKTEIGDELIKIFKVEKVQNGSGTEIVTSIYEGEKQPGDIVNTSFVYDPIKKEFQVKGLQIKKRKELIEGTEKDYNWQNLIMPDNYLAGNKYPTFGTTNDTIQEGNELPYTIPNVFYFKMRAVHELDDKTLQNDERLVKGEKSKEKPLAIDVSDSILPAPEKLEAKDNSQVPNFGGEISFEGVDLEPYILYMFDPIGIQLSLKEGELTDEERNRRTYEVFVYQEQNQSNVDFENAYQIQHKAGEEIDFKATIADKNMSYVQALRDGQVIRIDEERYINKYPNTDSKEEIKLQVKGLDPNTPYYVVVRVRVDRYKEGKDLGPIYSIYTKHATFTTDTNTLPPIPEDKVPTAPQDFWSEGPAEDKKEVFIHWTESEFMKYQEGEIYYELVRTTDTGLGAGDDPEKSAQELASFGKVFLINPGNPSDTEKTFIQQYQGSGFVNVQPLQPAQTSKVNAPNSNEQVQAFTYIDTDLFPNTIYYYYVRTVHKVGEQELRSEFIMIPVTTDPVGKPINLKVESEKDYSFDTTKEAYISFWAPVPQSGMLGVDYDFEIAIQSEEDGKFYTANQFEEGRTYGASYKTKIVQNEMYTQFVYKIDGLKHGKSYDVKVRIVDKTKARPAYSAYSDKVRFRTDFDELEQDKEDKYKEYLEQYDREAEKLKNNPYWLSESIGKEGVFKYRKNYLEGLLQGSGTYGLETLTFEEGAYYYLPRSIVGILPRNNKMLEVELSQFQTYIRANTFVNEETIKEAEQRLKDKEIKDYYIGIEVVQNSTKGTVEGNKIITPELTIQMEVVYTSDEDFLVEEYIMESLVELIAIGRNNLIKALDNEMDRVTFREEKVEGFIEDEIEWIQDEHRLDVKSIMRKTIDGRDAINTIKAPLLVVAKTSGTLVEGYYKGYSWEKLYTFQTIGGYGVEASKLGSYVFTAKSMTSVMLPSIPGAENMIQKYYLSDFFRFDTSALQGYVTKQQFYGSLARMIGGTRDADPVLTLQNRGIKLIMPQNVYQTMRMDEAVYVTMQAYEKMYYKPINTIVIQNTQQVQNIMAFQPAYRPYVQAAVQLKVIEAPGNRIVPTEPLTVEQLIKMLVKIMPN